MHERPRPWLRPVSFALLAWMLALLSAAPSLHYFERDYIFTSRAGEFIRQCADPLTRSFDGPPILAYRIFVPTLAWLVGARMYGALAIAYAASIALLSIVHVVMTRRHGRGVGTAATLLVATSYAVTWPNCMPGYPDSVAHLLAACLLLSPGPWLVGPMVAAGLLTDERFALEIPLVLIWYYSDGPERGGRSWLNRSWLPVLAGISLCLVVRHALTVGWIGPGVAEPKTYQDIRDTIRSFHPYNMSWAVWVGNVAMGFRWTWSVILAALWLRVREAGSRGPVPLAVVLAGSVAASMLVFDTARSVGFSYLAILISLSWIAESSPARALTLGRACAWLCLLTPSLCIVPGFAIWWRPLPLRIYAFLSNHDPLQGVHWLSGIH